MRRKVLLRKKDFFPLPSLLKGYLLQPIEEPCCAAIERASQQPGPVAEETQRRSESVKLDRTQSGKPHEGGAYNNIRSRPASTPAQNRKKKMLNGSSLAFNVKGNVRQNAFP